VRVALKDVKHLYIKVDRNGDSVHVTAPSHYSSGQIESFVAERIPWIEQQLHRIKEGRAFRSRNAIVHGAVHNVMGVPFKLRINEVPGGTRPSLEKRGKELHLEVPLCSDQRLLRKLMAKLHRIEMKRQVPSMICRWEEIMGVRVSDFRVRKMKTLWGSCNPEAGRIWLNLELSLRPIELLECVLVHEMVHLLEPSHNRRFKSLMKQFIPDYQRRDRELETVPLGYFS